MTIRRYLLPALFAIPLSYQGDVPSLGVPYSEVAPGPFAEFPPAPGAQADPADSLYRAGREAINKGDFRRAAELFAEIGRKHPRSEYAADALYWRAYSLYREGGEDELREALKSLDTQAQRFPKASTIGDANGLRTRIRGALAQLGDSKSAERISVQAGQSLACPKDGDDDVRTAALNALLQMDADNALPILKQVLQKRDECSAAMRKKAVFLLSQKRSSDTEALLIDVIRNDPSRAVKEDAVFWLGQVNTDRAAAALEEIALSSSDTRMREKAIFALGQQNFARSGGSVLRRVAESNDSPRSVREQAIFQLGQKRSAENAEYLRGMFERMGKAGTSDNLRKSVLFSLSQMRGVGNDRWLLNIALNESESEDIRKHALFTAGQAGIPGSELVTLYDRISDRGVKEHLIWVMSDSRDAGAIDKLIDIAQKDRDMEMRKKALFWLGQKRDPRIVKLLTDIITKP